MHRVAIAAAVNAKYDIESIRGLDQINEKPSCPNLFSSESTSESRQSWDETIDRLCSPVSPDSYELTGVADGQEIKFRIGFADCQNPDAQIIITSTPDQAMTPDDFERQTAQP